MSYKELDNEEADKPEAMEYIMELGVGAVSYGTARKYTQQTKQDGPKPETTDNKVIELQRKQQVEEQRERSLVSAESIDALNYFREILKFTEFFNKKLKFNIDRSSELVIVKVVDSETDKVIKEIPPEQLKRLHSSMKKAIGLLIDEQR